MPQNLLYIGNILSQHGYNKTTIETLGALLEAEGYRVLYTSHKKNQLWRLLDMVVTTFLKAKKVDYIIIDTYSTSSFWYAFFCSQIARFWGKKYIPFLHGGDLPNRLQKNPKICNLLFKNAFINVAPSGYLKYHFEKQGFTNITLIPNTLEIQNYPFKKRSLVQPNLLWVRAFAKIYNPKMAIDVLLEVQKKYPMTTLTMVGNDKDGSMQTCKKYAQQQNIKVEFTGKLSKEEWLKRSETHDIFINTTHFDNTPVSVVEALALGMPVISTSVGGIPFLVEDKTNALLINDSDVLAMVLAIETLVETPTLAQKLSENGRALAEQFDWEHVKKQWEKILS